MTGKSDHDGKMIITSTEKLEQVGTMAEINKRHTKRFRFSSVLHGLRKQWQSEIKDAA